MTSDKFNIGELRIASPCPVGWEQMKGDKRKRLCDHCSLSVFNISEMSGREVEELIRGSGGRVCARLYRRADGTVMTRDCGIGLSGGRWRITRLAGAALAAIIGMVSVTLGQSETKSKEKTESLIVAPVKILRIETKGGLTTVNGVIKDAVGAVIPGATVTIFDKRSGFSRSATSDGNGDFDLIAVPGGTYSIKFEAAGFKDHKISAFIINNNEDVRIELVLGITAETVTIGIIASDEPIIDMSKSSLEFRITRPDDK